MKNAELLKTATLETTKHTASCIGCDHNYCCLGQKRIEISSIEFKKIKSLITQAQKNRAMKQIHRFKKDELFDCPFNDPDTGKCEIYEDRFLVCAQYAVINPKEHCNSDTMHDLQVVNPMVVIHYLISNPTKYSGLLDEMTYLSEGMPMNMIDAWDKYLKKEI